MSEIIQYAGHSAGSNLGTSVGNVSLKQPWNV